MAQGFRALSGALPRFLARTWECQCRVWVNEVVRAACYSGSRCWLVWWGVRSVGNPSESKSTFQGTVTLWLFLSGRTSLALIRMRVGYPGGTSVTAIFTINRSSDKPAGSRTFTEWSSQQWVWVRRTGWARLQTKMGRPSRSRDMGGWRAERGVRLWVSSCFHWSNGCKNTSCQLGVSALGKLPGC